MTRGPIQNTYNFHQAKIDSAQTQFVRFTISDHDSTYVDSLQFSTLLNDIRAFVGLASTFQKGPAKSDQSLINTPVKLTSLSYNSDIVITIARDAVVGAGPLIVLWNALQGAVTKTKIHQEIRKEVGNVDDKSAARLERLIKALKSLSVVDSPKLPKPKDGDDDA